MDSRVLEEKHVRSHRRKSRRELGLGLVLGLGLTSQNNVHNLWFFYRLSELSLGVMETRVWMSTPSIPPVQEKVHIIF